MVGAVSCVVGAVDHHAIQARGVVVGRQLAPRHEHCLLEADRDSPAKVHDVIPIVSVQVSVGIEIIPFLNCLTFYHHPSF